MTDELKKNDNEIAVAAQAESLPEGDESNQKACEQCGNANIEDGYLVNLCGSCRTELSKFRLPAWVKGFALLVLVVLVFALIKFPNTLNTGVAFEKAVQFEHEKKYLSAMKEYEKVVSAYPDSITALSKLFITQFKMGRVGKAADTYDKIAGKSVDDDQLFNEVDSVYNQLDAWYYPSKNYNELLSVIKNVSIKEARDRVEEYVSRNPKEVYPRVDLAYILVDIGDVEKAKEVAQGILEENPDYIDSSFLLGYIYRETKEYDKAIDLYNKILENNVERADAYSAIARIEIKRGNDKQGLDMALKAYNMDNADPYIISNLVLAYHFNNMSAERDKAFEEFKNQKDYNEDDLVLLTGIINGTNNEWRD